MPKNTRAYAAPLPPEEGAAEADAAARDAGARRCARASFRASRKDLQSAWQPSSYSSPPSPSSVVGRPLPSPSPPS